MKDLNNNMPVQWNAKQIPPGVRDFTYVDDIVVGVTRVIDNPPGSHPERSRRVSESKLDARVPGEPATKEPHELLHAQCIRQSSTDYFELYRLCESGGLG